jgi:hypothetical protein
MGADHPSPSPHALAVAGADGVTHHERSWLPARIASPTSSAKDYQVVSRIMRPA